MAGDALDDAERLRSHRTASALACAAAKAASALLLGLAAASAPSPSSSTNPLSKPLGDLPMAAAVRGGTGPASGDLLDALLEAHARLCVEPESLAACLGTARSPTEVRHDA